MKVIKISALVLFIFLSTGVESQSDLGKFILFKMYKNAEFDLGRTQASTTVSLGSFSPAIAWGEDANFHEIQITSLNFASRSKTFLYSGGAEYTYNHRLSDNKESAFNFFVGGGFGAGFSTKNSSIVNASSITIPTIGKFINLNLLAIPRLTYDIKNNIALELSMSYNILQFQNSKQTAADPSLPINAQTNVYNDFEFFPRLLSLKLGGIIRF